MKDLILTQAQAQTIYNAMCQLNNICIQYGKIQLNGIKVEWDEGVAIQCVTLEEYETQQDFVKAYNLID